MKFNKPQAQQARIKDPIDAGIGTHDSLLEAGQFIVTLVCRAKSMMTSAKAVIPGLTCTGAWIAGQARNDSRQGCHPGLDPIGVNLSRLVPSPSGRGLG